VSYIEPYLHGLQRSEMASQDAAQSAPVPKTVAALTTIPATNAPASTPAYKIVKVKKPDGTIVKVKRPIVPGPTAEGASKTPQKITAAKSTTEAVASTTPTAAGSGKPSKGKPPPVAHGVSTEFASPATPTSLTRASHNGRNFQNLYKNVSTIIGIYDSDFGDLQDGDEVVSDDYYDSDDDSTYHSDDSDDDRNNNSNSQDEKVGSGTHDAEKTVSNIIQHGGAGKNSTTRRVSPAVTKNKSQSKTERKVYDDPEKGLGNGVEVSEEQIDTDSNAKDEKMRRPARRLEKVSLWAQAIVWFIMISLPLLFVGKSSFYVFCA